MSDQRKNSKWIIRSVIGLIIVFSILIIISVWILSLPEQFVGWLSKILVIISDFISVGISIFVGRYYVGKMLQDRGFDLDKLLQDRRFVYEKKLQDREKKITHSKDMADNVYSPLYLQIKNEIIPTLEEDPFSLKVFFNEWERIKKGPKEVFMDMDLKKRLNDFSTAINTHYKNVYNFKTKTLPNIFNEEANSIYQPPNKKKFKLRYSYKEDKSPSTTDLYNPYNPEGSPYFPERTEKIIECLRTNTNPKDYITKPGRTITGFWIKDIDSDWENNDETKFNKFWQSFKNIMDQNKEFISIPQEANNILKEANIIMKQLENDIKQSRPI